MKKIRTLLLFIALIVAPTVSIAPGTSEAATVWSGVLDIPSARIRHAVYRTDTIQEAQASIDSCRGATALPRQITPGVTWLAAHRTSCGSRGFGGIEKLKAGTRFTLWIDGSQATYEIINDGIVTTTTAGLSAPRPADTAIVLQTSKSTSKNANPYYVYLKFARLVSVSWSASATDADDFSVSDPPVAPSIDGSSEGPDPVMIPSIPVEVLSTGPGETEGDAVGTGSVSPLELPKG